MALFSLNNQLISKKSLFSGLLWVLFISSSILLSKHKELAGVWGILLFDLLRYIDHIAVYARGYRRESLWLTNFSPLTIVEDTSQHKYRTSQRKPESVAIDIIDRNFNLLITNHAIGTIWNLKRRVANRTELSRSLTQSLIY